MDWNVSPPGQAFEGGPDTGDQLLAFAHRAEIAELAEMPDPARFIFEGNGPLKELDGRPAHQRFRMISKAFLRPRPVCETPEFVRGLDLCTFLRGRFQSR